MREPLYFDEISVGDQWVSRGRTVTEADVGSFAGLTGDFDPLHVDHEFAKQSAYGRPIAHGLLGLSFLAGLSSTCPAVYTDAFVAIQNWEFRLPIFLGDTVRVRTIVKSADQTSRRRGRVVWERSLINQRDEVVQAGLFETLVAARKNQQSSSPDQEKDSPRSVISLRDAA